MRAITVSCAGAVLAACGHALTVGELLTSGAYRIEAHELRRLVSGQQTENAFLSAERVWTNLADGSLSGVSIGVDQRRVKGSGRWNITPRGQYCVDIAWEGASANETWCCFVFRRGNAFFGAPSDDPQSGHVHRLNVRAGE